MKKKVTFSLLFIICVVSCSLLLTYFIVNSNKAKYFSNAANEDVSDFDDIKKIESFDVSDFSFKEKNTLDIPSLNYSNGKISILGSDFKLSNALESKVYDLINSYGAGNSFYIVSLEDNMSIGYNIDKAFETASSIKAPYALYVSREIAKGNIDPDRKIAYVPKYHNAGTGVVKNYDYGTEFTVRELIYYSLTESDNVAHTILHGTFGVKGYNAMLKELKTKQLYLTAGNPWGFTSARSAAIIWQDIYNFALEDSEGVTLLDTLSNGKYNYYKEILPQVPSASKTGFANKDVVESGIVFDKHPYIAICIANKGGTRGAYTQILNYISLMNDIMKEYDDYLQAKTGK